MQPINNNLNGCFCSLCEAFISIEICENELLHFTVQIDIIIRILNEELIDGSSEMEWKEEKSRGQESEKWMKELINRHESSQVLIIGKKRKHAVRECAFLMVFIFLCKKNAISREIEKIECIFATILRSRHTRRYVCVIAVYVPARLCVCVSVSWKIDATPICRWGNEKYLEPMWMNDWMWRHENTFFSLVFIQNTRNTKRLNILCYTHTLLKGTGEGEESNKNIKYTYIWMV